MKKPYVIVSRLDQDQQFLVQHKITDEQLLVNMNIDILLLVWVPNGII